MWSTLEERWPRLPDDEAWHWIKRWREGRSPSLRMVWDEIVPTGGRIKSAGRARAAWRSWRAQATAEPSRTKPQGWATATRGR